MTTESDNAGQTHKGGPWAPGVSGNPAGMKVGTRHRATRLAEKLMADDIEGVVNAVVTAAQGGDMQACKIVLDRIAPPCRGQRVRLLLPQITAAADPPWDAALRPRSCACSLRGPRSSHATPEEYDAMVRDACERVLAERADERTRSLIDGVLGVKNWALVHKEFDELALPLRPANCHDWPPGTEFLFVIAPKQAASIEEWLKSVNGDRQLTGQPLIGGTSNREDDAC